MNSTNPMQLKNDVIINATKWMGDVNILAMDWDCQGMLLRLILFSSQQAQQGYLPFNEALIKKVLSNPSNDDWENRIRPQLLSVLKVKQMEVSGVHGEYLYYPEYTKALDLANGIIETPKKTRKKKIKVDVGAELVNEECFFNGFALETIIKAKTTTTILYEKSTEEMSSTIWDVGVSILMPQKKDEGACRRILGRMIKLYGTSCVSAAIADISGRNLKAANMEAFMMGIAKSKSQEAEGLPIDGKENKQPASTKARPTSYGSGGRTITGKVVL